MNTEFRIWDKEKNIFCNINNIYLDCFGHVYEDVEYESPSLLSQNDFIIEQFTGLKDKNNKKIFEGDIVLAEKLVQPLSEDDKTVFVTCQVVWSDELAGFGVKMLNYREKMDGYSIPLRKDDYPLYSISKMKIIGNIHENSELIKE